MGQMNREDIETKGYLLVLGISLTNPPRPSPRQQPKKKVAEAYFRQTI